MIRKARQSKLAAAGFAKRIMKNHIVEDAYEAKSPGRQKKSTKAKVAKPVAEPEPEKTVDPLPDVKPRGRGRPRKKPLPEMIANEASPTKAPPKLRKPRSKRQVKEVKPEEEIKEELQKTQKTIDSPKDQNMIEILGKKRPRLELNRLELEEDTVKIVEEPKLEAATPSPVKSPQNASPLSLDISPCSDRVQSDSSMHSPKPAYKTLITYKKSKKERTDSKPLVSTEDIDEIIEAAKRRSILSPVAGSPLEAPMSPVIPDSPVKMVDASQVEFDSSIRYPCADVEQQFFQRVGLIKKSDLKLEDPTKSKLHREGGGRLRRHIKPKMAPQMIYKKLQLAKGCVLRGVMDGSDEEDFRVPSRDSSPRGRSRPGTPRHPGHAAAAKGSPSAAMKLDFDGMASPPREGESILDRRSKLVQLKKTLRSLTGASAPFVKLYERPDRVKKRESSNTRKSSRQSKRKEWWHLLRANPDEYEEDLGWTEEQVKKERRRQLRLDKVEEELKQHGLSLQALQDEMEKEDEEARKGKRRKKTSGELPEPVAFPPEVIEISGSQDETTKAEAPKRVRRRKKKGKARSISIVGPDGKPLDPRECGSLLDELKPLLVNMMKEADESVGSEVKEEEGETICQVTIEAASSLVPMEEFYSYDPVECVFPHMCNVCHRNDHSYSEDKWVKEKEMAYGACIHRTPCPHFGHQRKLRAAPKVPEVKADPPSCEGDLFCAEEMLNDSDHEQSVEPLKAQLAVRAAQIQSSLGVSSLPIISSPAVKEEIPDDEEEEEEEEEEEVVVELLGANQILEQSTGKVFPPNFNQRWSHPRFSDNLVYGVPESILADSLPVLPAYSVRLIDQFESHNRKSKVPLKQSLIKVKVQRLDKHRLVIKQSVHDRNTHKQFQETTIREIKMPKDCNGQPVIDSEFISNIIAKEAMRLVSESGSKNMPEVTDKMRMLLTKNEVKKLEISLSKLLEKDPEGLEVDNNVDLFGLHSIEEQNPEPTKCSTITYKILPPTAEESARELQRTKDSVEKAKSHEDQDLKEIVFQDSEIQGDENSSSISFTTRDISMQRPGVMACIKKQKLKNVLTQRLQKEEEGLVKMIDDAQFLVAKLKEEVSQKQILLDAIKLQNIACKEEKEQFVKSFSESKVYCPDHHNHLKGRARVYDKMQVRKTNLLESYNRLLDCFGHLCKGQPQDAASQPAALTTDPPPLNTPPPPSAPPPPTPQPPQPPPPVLFSQELPTTSDEIIPLSADPPGVPASSTVPAVDNGQFLQIPVPVPNQPGHMAILNLDRNLIGKKGQQSFTINFGSSKFVVSLSNPSEPVDPSKATTQVLPNIAPTPQPALKVQNLPKPTPQPPIKSTPQMRTILPLRNIAPAPPASLPPTPPSTQFLYASTFAPVVTDQHLLNPPTFTDAQAAETYVKPELASDEVVVEEQAIETLVETSDNLVQENYKLVQEDPEQCYDHLPTSQALVRNSDLLQTAMTACHLEKAEESAKLTDAATSNVEAMRELSLPGSFLMDDGCQMEEFLDEVVVGREQEVFSQEMQTTETVVQSGQELVVQYSL